ncbi:MAG: hypothetical protein QGI45_01960 [Myxococcota bacterium]|jgi:hypothetical protein|nr:hypothetical protein [Myxococcota bacterium]
MTKLSKSYFLFIFLYTAACEEDGLKPSNPAPEISIAQVKHDARAVVEIYFLPPSKCFDWLQEDIERLLGALNVSIDAAPVEQIGQYETKKISALFRQYCEVGKSPQKPNLVASISLLSALKGWNERKLMKSTLLTSLQARARAYQKFTELVDVTGHSQNGAEIKLQVSDYRKLTGLMAKLAHPNRFVRVFPAISKAFLNEDFNTEAFLTWFQKRLATDPHTGLLTFSEELIWYELDPSRYLELKDLLSTSNDTNKSLAKTVYHASNNFVLRGKAPNEYSLRDVVKTMLKQKSQSKLNDKNVHELITLLKAHRKQDSSGTYFIDLTQIKRNLSRK